jgi:hypothetical protein
MNTEQLKKFLSRLPEDIQNTIHYEHVRPDLILTELNQILKSEESKKLNCEALYYYLKNVVLTNPIVVENLISNDEIFKIVYDKHITREEKNFVLIKDPIESMAQSWLMYLYH